MNYDLGGSATFDVQIPPGVRRLTDDTRGDPLYSIGGGRIPPKNTKFYPRGTK